MSNDDLTMKERLQLHALVEPRAMDAVRRLIPFANGRERELLKALSDVCTNVDELRVRKQKVSTLERRIREGIATAEAITQVRLWEDFGEGITRVDLQADECISA